MGNQDRYASYLYFNYENRCTTNKIFLVYLSLFLKLSVFLNKKIINFHAYFRNYTNSRQKNKTPEIKES
jgi:hypothetical protein